MHTSEILNFLIQRKKNQLEKEPMTSETRERIAVLPPFDSQIAILKSHRNKWKLLAVVSAGFSVLSLLTGTVLINHKLFQKMNSEYIVVPGAAEFIKVRPNLIPDAVVKDFAEFVATYAGNFTYRNAKNHFETVAERMGPELKGRFMRDAEAKFSEWNKRRVDQVFAFEPMEIHVGSDKFGAKYILLIQGRRTQYADGTMLQETDENLYLELRPRVSLSAGKRFDESLLIIERLEWVSRSQGDTLIAMHLNNENERTAQK